MSVTDGLGQPIHVLSLALRDEYRHFVPKPSEVLAPDIQPWVHKYPLACVETAGMGLAKQRHLVVIELKAKATPMRVRQCPMSQEAQQGITPHIRQLMDAGILKRCQFPWNPLTTSEEAREYGLQTCPRPMRSQQVGEWHTPHCP